MTAAELNIDRERLGRVVRGLWLAWALVQVDARLHRDWLLPWEKLSEPHREVDRQIGEGLYALGAAEMALLVREVLGEFRARARRPLMAAKEQTTQRERSRARAMLELLDGLELTLTAGELPPAEEPTAVQDVRHHLERDRGC